MQFCCTDVPIHKFEYKWTIKKFGLQLKLSEQHENDFILKSASCVVGDWKNNIKWYFQLNIYGSESEHKDYIGIAALSENTEENTLGFGIRSWQQYFFLNARNERCEIYSTLESLVMLDRKCNEFCKKAELLDESNSFLVNDELTIICQINIMGDPITITENRIIEATTSSDNYKISNDVAKLFETKKYADITIMLGDNTMIRAHRTILMARSAVFADIINKEQPLQRKSKQNDDLVIELKDLFLATCTELFRYIYTDTVENIEDMEMALLTASYEYQLEGLKAMCIDSLCKTITVDCAMGTFEMAVRYQCEKLMKFTVNFIFSRMADVVCTDEFQCMLIDNPELVERLLAKDN